MSLSLIVSIIGFPSIFSIVAYCIKMIHEYRQDLKAHEASQEEKMTLLMAAYQEQMKDRLMQSYREYAAQGWISEEEFQVWESQYNAYHSLGHNGYMTDRYEKLAELPRTKPVKKTATKKKVNADS